MRPAGPGDGPEAMRPPEQRTSMDVILEARHGEDGLAVRWRDHGESHYPWFWLRDHGEDAASLDPETLQRRASPSARSSCRRPCA